MAKPLGAKALLIREAIKAHLDKGNKEIAELINGAHERKDDKISVKAGDVAQQKQAMKKAPPEAAPEPVASERPTASKLTRKKGGRKPGRQATAGSTSSHGRVPAPALTPDVFAHVEAIREAVRKLGADQVHRIVGLFE